MSLSGCDRWLLVYMSENNPIKISKIELLFPGDVPEVEVNNAKKYIASKVSTEVANRKIGRNDSCPCGSGKKYKNCHGFG